MGNAWDVPALPSFGDVDKEVLFAAVGRALSQWEYFEGYLGELYSFLISSHLQTTPAMRVYGSSTSFANRLDMIRTAATTYFIINNEPYLELLKSLLSSAQNFAPRRNDIAHGIVQTLTPSSALLPQTYALVPSRHATRRSRIEHNLETSKFDVVYEYAYTSKELNYFRECFDTLANKAIETWTAFLTS
jgi:hypothetical protein